MIKEATDILSQGKDLSAGQMQAVMEEIMSGKNQTADITSFLTALNKQGETIDEVTAAAMVMRLHATKIHISKQVVLDTCGTGADAKGTFNISTAVAFIASGCGITVAKHGNRSVSSACGSADILEALGINIHIPAKQIEKCLDEIGIAFLFAQDLHPAMKYAMPARKEIAAKTIFNILGPLSNPAGAKHQLVGVYDKRWTALLAMALRNLGSRHALVVHGKDGIDEITTTDSTFIAETNRDNLNSYEITPEDFGFKRARLADLTGKNAEDNKMILLDVLSGKLGPHQDIVVLNAAAAIYAADKAGSIKEGIKMAYQSIESGAALKKLELLKDYSK